MTVYWNSPGWLWPLLLVLAVGAVSLTFWAYRQTWPRPARTLGRVLILLRSSALVVLVAALGAPVIAMFRSVQERPELVLVLEDSASMAIADARTGSADDSLNRTAADRWSRALALAAGVDSLLAASNHRFDPVFLRGNGLEAVVDFSGADPAIAPPVSQGSDLGQLLRQVGDRMAGRPARAVVLFSDGQETAGQDPGGARSPLAGAGRPFGRGTGSVPLIAVGVGDPQGPADRLLKDLRYPATAYQGDEVVVELAVDHRFTGSAPLPAVTARLHGPAGVVAEATVPVEGDLVPIELVFRPEAVGPQVYRLEVSPLANERFLANNEVSLAIDVRQERAQLLLLCAVPDWDVRFLAQAASREQRLSVSVVYPRAAGLVYADSLVPWQEPATVEEWSRWDGVVLLGWSGLVAEMDWARVAAAAADGMGLLVLPGQRTQGQPGTMNPLPAGLAALLPVTVSSGDWVAGPAALATDPQARDHAVLEGVIDPTATGAGGVGRGLSELPPLREVLRPGLRPGARVLLRARGRPGVSGAEAGIPVLVVASPGDGRIAWFGGRNLWELAFWETEAAVGPAQEETEQIARKLARNLLLWVAEGEKERELVFSGRRASYQEGEKLRLAATWLDLRGQPVTGRKLSLTLTGPESGDRTFPLQEVVGDAGAYEVVLPPLPPGVHSVQLSGQGDPPVRSRRESLIVTRHSIESTQVRQEPRRLRQLAAAPGDAYVDGHGTRALEEVARHLADLDWSARSSTSRARRDLLAGWPFLALMTLLLGLEWFLRRRNGML